MQVLVLTVKSGNCEEPFVYLFPLPYNSFLLQAELIKAKTLIKHAQWMHLKFVMKESGRVFLTSYKLKSWHSIMNGVPQHGLGITRSVNHHRNVNKVSAYTFFFNL